ncbi:hypothetical protein ACS0TY_029281 [Phlomoides rotata]
MTNRGCEIPATESDMETSRNSSNTGAIVAFDEHPLTLEPESELNVGQDELCEEDGRSGEGSDEGETEGEIEEYEFQFEGEMDPLSFAEEEDASGLQPYERFEQIEHDYEALAAKKRPALQNSQSESPAKRLRQEDRESFEQLMESMNCGRRKKSRKMKRRGRKKGSKNKASPEVTRKLGDATLYYAQGRYEEAIIVLKEVIRLAPNLSDSYHTLGLIYKELKNEKKSFGFYMIAAHLDPKDSSLWKNLLTRSIELGDKRQANYCLNKAITADPGDIDLWFDRASLYFELGEYQKAADSYEQISRLCPDNIDALKKATQLYLKCGQHQRAVCMLEKSLRPQVDVVTFEVLDLLVSVLMEINEYARAFEHIERSQKSGKEIPLDLIIKAGMCQVHLGHLEKAEAYFTVLEPENASSNPHLIVDVADSLMTVAQYKPALKYYMMLEEDSDQNNGFLHLKTARCYVSLKQRAQAIEYYYKAVQKLDDSVDARLMLSSLLLEEGRDDEAISVLSTPVKSESHPDTCKGWCCSGKIKLKLSQIYKSKGSFEDFANVLFPVIHETLSLEIEWQKVKVCRRLTKSVLSERMKVLEDHQTESVFHGFRPVASSADRSKASRAKKTLQKKAAEKEEERAAALAAGIEWRSEDSDDESPQVPRTPPLTDFLKEEENLQLIVDLCKSLSSLQRYWDALKIVDLSLKLDMSVQIKEELRTLGAQFYFNSDDPGHGWDYVRDFVAQNPLSFTAWNCFYKGILRDNRLLRHNKFLHRMKNKHKNSVPPILVVAHQFTMISQHQIAAREYLEAYKLMPDNPLINLCAGTALINLALGHRLQNKHQTVLQGLAFLYNNSRLCPDSQVRVILAQIFSTFYSLSSIFLVTESCYVIVIS